MNVRFGRGLVDLRGQQSLIAALLLRFMEKVYLKKQNVNIKEGNFSARAGVLQTSDVKLSYFVVMLGCL